MHITMNDDHVDSIAALTALVKIGNQVEFRAETKEEMYAWIAHTLERFRYFARTSKKKARGTIIAYVMTMTGLSRAQVKRLIKRKKQTGKILRITGTRNTFKRTYTPDDVALLAKTDNAHQRLSGKATAAICKREYGVYGKREYERLARISVSHLYTLRGRRQYESHALTFTKTNPTAVPIGIRKKPRTDGKPGYLRVDSVHQGDLGKIKGVYHINLVDEVTQWEIVVCVEGISEAFLRPALLTALAEFPFVIRGFHSDNGSEYINYVVADLLEKMRIEQTKSRSRRTNDNALVECKNGAVVRKHFGYVHIPKKYAVLVSVFQRTWFDTYLNFHRPCGFSTLKIDHRGTEKKKYDIYRTPFEQLKTILGVEQYLKPGITIASLETTAREHSDTDYATLMQNAKQKLFETLKTC